MGKKFILAIIRFWTNGPCLAINMQNLFFCRGMDEDISRLKTTALSLLADLGCNGSVLPDDLINEMCRFGASELHVVAAFVGGIASQEVIKVRLISLPRKMGDFEARHVLPFYVFFQMFCSSSRSSLYQCWELSFSTALITILSHWHYRRILLETTGGYWQLQLHFYPRLELWNGTLNTVVWSFHFCHCTRLIRSHFSI